MNTTPNEIVERIRKCLALANGKNATQGEMEVAMAKAKEIAMRFQIDIASIKLDKGESAPAMAIERDDTLKTGSQYQQPYHSHIFHILTFVFGVRVILNITSGKHGPNKILSTIHLIGEATDVAIAKVIFAWLEGVFPSTKTKLAAQAGITGTINAAFCNGVYLGLYRGILEANKKAEQALSADDTNRYALVVVNKNALVQKRVEADFSHLRSTKAHARKLNDAAYQAGFKVGSALNLRQMNGAAKEAQLN